MWYDSRDAKVKIYADKSEQPHFSTTSGSFRHMPERRGGGGTAPVSGSHLSCPVFRLGSPIVPVMKTDG